MKIAVYAIALNEAAHVERWLASVQHADHVVYCDTGSTDKSQELVFSESSNPALVGGNASFRFYDISIKPWRFDDARNAALALVPSDVDVCIALDLDEELQPGWREALERAWKPGTTRLRHPFAFTQDENGAPAQVMYGHRIHDRHAYRWQYPIHEALTFKGDGTERIAWCDDLWIYHKPAAKESRAQYLPMLAKAAAADQGCQRMAFYHARELMYNARWIDAIREFNRFLELPITPNFPAGAGARAEAMRFLGRCHEQVNEDAAKWFMMACLEHPTSRQAWFELADNRRRNDDWIGGVWAAQNAIACQMPRGELYDTYQMNIDVYDVGGQCAYYAGLKELAGQWFLMAVTLDPKNERLRKNLSFVTPS